MGEAPLGAPGISAAATVAEAEDSDAPISIGLRGRRGRPRRREQRRRALRLTAPPAPIACHRPQLGEMELTHAARLEFHGLQCEGGGGLLGARHLLARRSEERMRLPRAVVDLAHNRTHRLLLLIDLRAACAKLGLVARALLFELGLALAQPAPLVVAWLRLFDLVLLTLDLAPKLPKLEKLLAVPLELQRLLRGNPFEDCELLMQPSFPCAQQLDLQLLLTAFTLDELQFLGRVQGGEVRPFGAFDRVRQGRSRLAAYGCCGGKLIPQLHLGKGEGSFAFHVDHAM